MTTVQLDIIVAIREAIAVRYGLTPYQLDSIEFGTAVDNGAIKRARLVMPPKPRNDEVTYY